MSKERVAIAKIVEQRLDDAVARVVDLVAPLDEIVPAGSRVVIKPNYTIVPTDRGVTHPELVESIVRLVAQTSPGEIVIAESSGDYYTSYCYRFMGVQRIAARYGARLVDLGVEEAVSVPVPPELGRERVMLPKVVAESDVVISVPIFKLWGGSPLSLSLKNLFGLYGARYYGHNKHSAEIVKEHPFFGLPGEVGSERGVHAPSVAQSVCAINLACKTQLSIIDAIEGGDGVGNWVRLDTLIAGRNPVATDTVGHAMAGFDAAEGDITRLCAEYGLGPCAMDEIEVVGEALDDVAFDLTRLRENVLEMPLPYCLGLLSTGELLQMHRGQTLYGFLSEGAAPPAGREALIAALQGVIGAEGYYHQALAKLDEHARVLLGLIAEQGGTAGDLVAIRDAMSAHYEGGESLHYAPPARTLLRLGLAYPVEGLARPYYLLPEGLAAAL